MKIKLHLTKSEPSFSKAKSKFAAKLEQDRRNAIAFVAVLLGHMTRRQIVGALALWKIRTLARRSPRLQGIAGKLDGAATA